MALNKVFGGTEANFDRFPYAVFIENQLTFCTGTLISPSVVLTSGDCAFNIASGISSGVTVTAFVDCFEAGDGALRTSCEEQFPVLEAILHPDFQSSDRRDIGLLVLDGSSAAQPVTLIDTTDALSIGLEITTFGWGDIDGIFGIEDTLHETSLTFLDRTTCLEQIQSVNTPINETFLDTDLPSDVFCAVGNKNGLCSRSIVDRGNGFILKCDNAQEDFLIGVFGSLDSIGCGQDGIPMVVQALDIEFIQNELNNLGQLFAIGDFIEGQTCSGTVTASPVIPTPFPTFVPASWTCNAVFYNNQDGCDCGCGIPDPDCDVETNQNDVFNCPEFGDDNRDDFICLNAECVEWTCDPAAFNDGEVCDCGCGTPDPDCDLFPQPSVEGCEGVNDVCIDGDCKAVPDEWTCDAFFFNSNDGCDCDCGVEDPDCVDLTQQIFNCPNPGQPAADFICVNTECVEWTCDVNEFEDGETCHCGCGSQDPDCNNLNTPIDGCDGGEEICSSGECKVIPSDWTCGVFNFDSQDGCDCNCGVEDPDCIDQIAQGQVFNCPDPNQAGDDFICVDVECIEWTCDVEDYADGEICNCGCGSQDPDCDISPNLPILGCGVDLICVNALCQKPTEDEEESFLNETTFLIFGVVVACLLICLVFIGIGLLCKKRDQSEALLGSIPSEHTMVTKKMTFEEDFEFEAAYSSNYTPSIQTTATPNF